MPSTRFADPQTSHDAEVSVVRVNQVQSSILRLLAGGPLHDEALIVAYHDGVRLGDFPMASESGIRSRRAELVDLGLVEDSGVRERTWSGRSTIVWQVAE